MDGNLSREEMARIRESMKDVGIINLIFLEVAKGWINCLLRDQEEPDANVRTVKFENGPMSGKENTTGRSRLLQKLQCVHLISLNRYPLDCWILLQYRKK